MSSKRNPISRSTRIRVGITAGDPAGIGPVIIPEALRRLKGSADFLVIGDCSRRNFKPGVISRHGGAAAISYLEEAMRLIRKSEIDCLVTAPISKEAVSLAGFGFRGHTEYLAKQSGVREFAMMLSNAKLKFTLVTAHEPIKKVPLLITKERVSRAIRLTLSGLRGYFACSKPKIAVMGLNPHASDNGVIGDEEQRVILPAINALRRDTGVRIYGPLSADVAVAKALNSEFDALIAMYHDQALIALKATDRKSGVNLTLGLPFIRTSPLHGTAFDIAARPHLADPSSLIEAIKIAIQCAVIQKRA